MDDEAGKAIARRMEEERKEQEEEDKLRADAEKKAVTQLQEGERAKIAAAWKGSHLRLSVIDAAIREEENWGRKRPGAITALRPGR